MIDGDIQNCTVCTAVKCTLYSNLMYSSVLLSKSTNFFSVNWKYVKTGIDSSHQIARIFRKTAWFSQNTHIAAFSYKYALHKYAFSILRRKAYFNCDIIWHFWCLKYTSGLNRTFENGRFNTIFEKISVQN